MNVESMHQESEEGSDSSKDKNDPVEQEVSGENESQGKDNREEDSVMKNQVQAAPSYGTFTRFTIDSILKSDENQASTSSSSSAAAADRSPEENGRDEKTMQVKSRASDDHLAGTNVISEKKGVKYKCEDLESNAAVIDRERYPWLQCTRYKPPRLPSKEQVLNYKNASRVLNFFKLVTIQYLKLHTLHTCTVCKA